MVRALMRLLIINYEFPPLGGGAGNATACLAREWALAGHSVEILTGGFRGLPAREELDGYTIRRLPTPRAEQGQCSVPEMCAVMAASCISAVFGPKPDLVIAFFSIPGGPAAWLLHLLRGVPYIVSLRGGDVPGFDAKNLAALHAITNPLTALIWRNARAVVGNSAGLCQLAQNFMPGLAVPEIPNGVDTARFFPSARPSGTTCELLFVGRLAPQKGVDILLNALARIPKGWRLRIAGDGPERERLSALAATLGLEGRVDFLGWTQRDALPELYRSADVFVFPSYDEGMPNVVLEALASGLPIVATRIAGNDQLVAEGENGTLVPPGDPSAFASALMPLIADHALRATLGATSRNIAVERFSWARSAAAYELLFPA
jgi:glycosyltransferase involved in cell wall biosynthesis